MHCLIYITCSKVVEAKEIARNLLEKKLIACANVFPNIESMYIWQGDVVEDSEVVLIVKSKKKLFSLIKEEVLLIHTYSNPCIIQLDISNGQEKYLKWIDVNCRN
jgi:periplasmic divalent cation tolerance protein